MRNLVVMGITLVLCLLSPFRPLIGLCGYYWFALMRPDILAWSGPNRYSLVIAVVTLVSNAGRALEGLHVIVTSGLCRAFVLLIGVISLSVLTAVQPELCYEQYWLFLRMAIMALLIPLVVRQRDDLKLLFLAIAISIGLLGAKYGLAGIIAGGARFVQGFGGMLSDNNTMALAFVVAVPLCWFGRLLMPQKWFRTCMAIGALLNSAAVIFTHSRGGALALAVSLLMIAWMSKHRILVGLIVIGLSGGAAYMVRDSFTERMGTLESPMEEASAKSRLVLAESAFKMSLDYPLLGVGFTERNEQELIHKYVPAEYREGYALKVIHNTYLQLLVDSGYFALLIYCFLLFGAMWKLRGAIKRAQQRGGESESAIPKGLFVGLVTYTVGSAFLSRTSFDFFYILAMLAATWLQIEKDDANSAAWRVAAAPAPPEDEPPTPEAPPARPPAYPWLAGDDGRSRLRMGRERRPRRS